MTKEKAFVILSFVSARRLEINNFIAEVEVQFLEKYSRGRRGAPAKGVGRATGARVQIPLSPSKNLFTSYSKTGFFAVLVIGCYR